MRAGRQLELLVDTLERVLANNPDVEIISPSRLRDITTGALREHDVVVTFKSGHHSSQVALECRDQSRLVGVSQLEAFHRKCVDTNINQGIIVSSSGFCKTTLTKANHLNIRCLLIDQIDTFDWLSCGSMPYTKWYINSMECIFAPAAAITHKPNNYTVISPNGETLEIKTLESFIKAHIFSNPSLLSNEAVSSYNFKLNLAGYKLIDLDRNEEIALAGAQIRTELHVQRTSLTFQKLVYSDVGTGEKIGQIAIAQFEVGGRSAEIVFSRNPDDSTSVKLVVRPITPSTS